MVAPLGLIVVLLVVVGPTSVVAQTSADGSQVLADRGAGPIPPGTIINMHNWQRYQQFMPDGMRTLFEGKYGWTMPGDVSIEVAPTVIHPLPRNYLAATEKYAAQVQIEELPNGGLNLRNYQGGIPFPNPQEPHKGWKILANLWYRYVPHLSVISYADGCMVDHYGSISCNAAEIVERQLAFNTDPGIPATIPGSQGKFVTQWLMVLEPEQLRYAANLYISYTDLSRPDDQFAFIPALRRYQPISTLARCSPLHDTDATPEELREGFDSNLTQVTAELLGTKKMLSLVDINLPQGRFPQDFDMPLGWPKPSWGKWQLRDVDVVSVSKLPAYASGYCYGKRVLYIDHQFAAPLWEDLYDTQGQPWKFMGLFLKTCNVPQIGPVNSCGALVWSYWNVKNTHATFFVDPNAAHPIYINEEAPKEYDDLVRYTTAPGLNEIMR
jgi:hypothetical protein